MKIEKNAIAFPISREMALDFGLVEPTEAEREERAAVMAQWQAKRDAAQPGIGAALAALDALNGVEREMLDLHSFDRTKRYAQECEGCDFSGFEGEPPAWPCRTVDLIARSHGIDLSEFNLYEPEA